MDGSAALRPLLEAADAIRRLESYTTTDELADAVRTVADALERALRVRLRNDPSAPEADRLGALSRDALPFEAVVKSLRTRDLISLEAAGTLYEARAAARRAEDGAVRAADADAVHAAAVRLREELEAGVDAAGATDGPGHGPEDGAEPGGSPAEPDPPAVRRADTSPGTGRWLAWLAAGVAGLVVLGAVWVFVQGDRRAHEDAVRAFRAGRYDSAAAAFERRLEDRPGDVTAMLYLGRSYRRSGRLADAAEVLRRAAEEEGRDPDVRRELGHLFMDLGRPVSAVAQYERALEYGPDDPLTWAGLIRALRAQGDPRAEQLLRDAPPEVQAALGGS